MDNHQVYLNILHENHDTILYKTEIQLINTAFGNRVLRTEDRAVANFEFNLGNLVELQNASLVVDTTVRTSSANEKPIGKVIYQVKYNNEIVEHTSVEAHFFDRTTAFFNFRFRFCPRFPFC